MAYDEELARRIRAVIADSPEHEPYTSERKMFGGLAFLVHGNMAVAAGSQGRMMVRCAREDTAAHIEAGAEPMIMRGSELAGWIEVTGEVLADDGALQHWVSVGLGYVDTLPPKSG